MGSEKTKPEKTKKRKNEHNLQQRDTKNTAHVSDHYAGKIITDSRFASVHSDPRFAKVPKQKMKVAIDSRFHRMFTDKSFASSMAPLDKRGKTMKNKSDNPLRRYYCLEEESEKDENDVDDDVENGEELKREEVEKGHEKKMWNKRTYDSPSVSSGESEFGSSEKEYSQGSETESTDDDLEDDAHEDYAEGPLAAPEEENISKIEKETHRLAIVNLDWSQVKAVDLYSILSSFLPTGGQILSVSVYPTEFGLKRMEEEALHGPVCLFDEEDEKDDDINEIDDEKLRAYELSKLRYYHAVVVCDSCATGDYLYKACDGVEISRSANTLDLRFIPDSMEFNHPPRDIATEVPASYAGLDYHTRALQQSKVNISWDEDEPHRVKTLKRKFKDEELADLELKEFLASDGSESDGNESDDTPTNHPGNKSHKLDKYRALLETGNCSDKEREDEGQDMEVTFNTGLEDISKRILEKDKKSETVWEAYLRKRREKKKAGKKESRLFSEDESSDNDQEAADELDDFFVEEPSTKRSRSTGKRKSYGKENQPEEMSGEVEAASKAELELLLADDKDANNNIKGYNLKAKKSKRKKGTDVPDPDKIPSMDYDDPRFSALFTSPLFALDPTDPQFKRSAAYARQLAEKKLKKSEEVLRKTEPPKSQQYSDAPQVEWNGSSYPDAVAPENEGYELSLLLKSVRSKSKQTRAAPNDKFLKEDRGLSSKRMEVSYEKNGLSSLVQSLKRKTKNLTNKKK